MTRARLDAELVRRKMARSRGQAADLIAAGRVSVAGRLSVKPATQVGTDEGISVASGSGGEREYASRGGHKLAGALDILAEDAPAVASRVCLDAGASTGGFTDVLLRRGARMVWAVDVGYGQLAWDLQADPRVQVRDRTNVRHLGAGDLDPEPSLVVSDLSFISLKTVIPALAQVASADADFLLMVKPQFEVGRAKLPHGGVVRNPQDWAESVRGVVGAAAECGLRLHAVAASPLPGPSGNVEFFVHLSREPIGSLDVEQADCAIAQTIGQAEMRRDA